MSRFMMEDMYRLARSGVTKIDLHGKRGATLVSSEEVIAMAAVLATHEMLPLPGQPTQKSKTSNGEQNYEHGE